jgi:hypothetical protein
MIAACGVSGAAFWFYFRQRWLAKRPLLKIEG